jgi:hypothetical protein
MGLGTLKVTSLSLGLEVSTYDYIKGSLVLQECAY